MSASFPPAPPSVIGQDLLERGFPRDASSSQLVLVYERKRPRCDSGRSPYVEDVAANLYQFALAHPELGIEKRPDSPATPLIGPRLIGTNAEGTEQAALVIVKFQGTYLSKKTRVAVDRILEWLKDEGPRAPGARTGCDRLGGRRSRHQRGRQREHQEHDRTPRRPGRPDLADRLSIAAAGDGPLVTIALSVMVSLRLIALLTSVPGLGFKVINITQVFVIVVLFGAGTDYCLFLIARYFAKSLAIRGDRSSGSDAAPRSDLSGRRGAWSPAPGR